MDLMQAHPVIAILCGLFIWKTIELGGNYFFKKVTRDDYITKADCQNCVAKRDKEKDEVCERLAEIRGIVLIVAVKAGIRPEELTDLTKG
jgi:predicted MarR family transcription regulator